MSKSDWIHPLIKLLAGLAVAGLLGWSVGYPGAVVSAFLAICLGWQIFNSIRLYNWLQNPETRPPKSLGFWSLIVDQVSTKQDQARLPSHQYKKKIREFERIANAFPDAILLIDSKGLVRWFNESATQMLNLTGPSGHGQAITSLIREPAFSDWLEEQDDSREDLVIHCPVNFEIILQLSTSRLAENQSLLILRDVTTVQNTERMRRDLVANVSHELRTPLTVLLGYLEILSTQPEDANPKAFKRMLKQARQMHTMLEELLTLSRLQDASLQSETTIVEMSRLLSLLSEQADDLSQGGHEFEFEIDQDLGLRGVEADLKSAFQNLLVNAVNYTPENGKISVSWSETPEGLVLSVKDNGIGIPHREIPRLTERFYRVGGDRNRKTGGTGLGLAIVKHVLNSHDARLEIISEVSVGSEFRCIFPLNRKA